MKKKKGTSIVHRLAKLIGGKVDWTARLPDGSRAKDHWIYSPGYNDPPMPFRTGTDNPIRPIFVEKIRQAARFAIRASTANGTQGYDPDAMVQQMVIGMLGYFTTDGLETSPCKPKTGYNL